MLMGMQYWEIVTRSFKITWRHKYLWLLALFAGESGGGFNFNSGSFTPPGTNGKAPDLNVFSQQLSQWVADHGGLIVAAAVIFILVAIAFFVLAAVCEGAVVRAAAEHDAERPFGLGMAWRTGRATMGAIIRFRLLLIALALPVLIVFGLLAIGLVAAIIGNNGAAIAVVVLIGVLFLLAAIVYAVALAFIGRLGARAVVLEQIGATAALGRGYTLLRKRLGRVLLVWLLSVAVGIALGICVAIVGAILVLPAGVIAFGAYASGSSAWWLVIVIAAVILLPIFLVISAFLAAQSSTYWTLAFRRLEIDQPAYAYGSPPPQVQQPPPGLPAT
jgi:hypothetical protein